MIYYYVFYLSFVVFHILTLANILEQNRTDILFQGVYKEHSLNTIYITTCITVCICYTEISHSLSFIYNNSGCKFIWRNNYSHARTHTRTHVSQTHVENKRLISTDTFLYTRPNVCFENTLSDQLSLKTLALLCGDNKVAKADERFSNISENNFEIQLEAYDMTMFNLLIYA